MKNPKSSTPTALKKIKTFWNWFQKKEIEITEAIEHNENIEQVFSMIDKKLNSISIKLSYVIKLAIKPNEKYTIIFTAHGNPKLFGKVTALEHAAPQLDNWQAQAFIKPTEEIEIFKLGLDEVNQFEDFELKTSDLYFRILDYNTTKKKLNIVVHLNQYRFHYDNDFLEIAVLLLIENLIGEIALKKNITLIGLAQLPNEPKNLIHLYELGQYIDRLNAITKMNKLII